MAFPAHYIDPDFTQYRCSAGVDFITVIVPEYVHAKVHFGDRANIIRSRSVARPGYRLTIHDARKKDLHKLAILAPQATLEELEVRVDFRPHPHLSERQREVLLRHMQDFLVDRLFPWGSPGLQVGMRVSNRPGYADDLIPGHEKKKAGAKDSLRRPGYNETAYFGHAENKWADPSKPNFASVRLYRKTTDHGGAVPIKERRMRLEVTLTRAGCASFGLKRLADVVEFNYRVFGKYFWLANPLVAANVPQGVAPRNSALWRAASVTLARIVQARVREFGAWAFPGKEELVIDRLRGHVGGNGRVQNALGSLSKKMRIVGASTLLP